MHACCVKDSYLICTAIAYRSIALESCGHAPAHPLAIVVVGAVTAGRCLAAMYAQARYLYHSSVLADSLQCTREVSTSSGAAPLLASPHGACTSWPATHVPSLEPGTHNVCCTVKPPHREQGRLRCCCKPSTRLWRAGGPSSQAAAVPA